MIRLGVIGGTGCYELAQGGEKINISTPYGPVTITEINDNLNKIYFLPRHGLNHNVPPHKVNYRANIYAMLTLNVDEVIATQAVGGLNPAIPAGSFAIAGNFIDFTHNRESTFFDGTGGIVRHVDVTDPYCMRIARGLKKTADEITGDDTELSAVYACMEGPRFESRAEISMLKSMGADVVGMTSVPEVVLAREAGLCYAAICIITNLAAGISPDRLTMDEVTEVMQLKSAQLQSIIVNYSKYRIADDCSCKSCGYPTDLHKIAEIR
jgi:5'-methylthioadenosine phosphorylase